MLLAIISLNITNTTNSLARAYLLSQRLGWLASFSIIIISIIFCSRSYQPRYMKTLPVYFLISGLTEVIAAIYLPNAYLIYWIYGVFEIMYFIYFFYHLLESPRKRGLLFGINIFFWVAMLLFIRFMKYVFAGSATDLLESATVVLLCVLYYLQLFRSPQFIELEKAAGFWMVTGILFYFFIRIPAVLFSGFYNVMHNEALSEAVYSINNYALIIAYGLFVKGMLCRPIKQC
jgi:hypothetical protein